MPENSLNALYPAPPQQQNQSLLSDPAKAIGLLSGIQEYKLRQQQFDALSQQPAASLEGTRIQNTTAQLEQDAKKQGFLVDSLGALADDPNLSYDKVRNTAVTYARNLKLPGEMVNSWLYSLPKDRDKLREALSGMRKIAIGSAGLSTPTDIGITEQNAPISGTRGQFISGALSSKATSGGGSGGAAGLVTRPAPGVAEAQVQTGAGSGAALNEARTHGLNYQQQVFPLEQAIPTLEKLGPKGSGPGTETINHLKSFAISNIPGITEKSFNGTVEDYDKAKKYLTDFVNQNGNSGTNDKLAAAFAGNPSVNISNAAATDVAKAALSLRRMKQAQLVEFERSGKPDNEYTKWASQWNLAHDPRVYGFDLMSPDQRKKVLSSLPEAKQQLFMMAVQDAAQSGIIKAPQAK